MINFVTIVKIIALLAAGMLLLLLVLPPLALVGYGLASGGWQSLPAQDAIQQAIALSLTTSACMLILTLLGGTPLAYALARWRIPGEFIWQPLIELPIIMPPAVAGLALLLVFGRQGLLGNTLQAADIRIAFTAAAVILAQTFVAAPFYIRAAQLGFASVPLELEEAARVDGAAGWQVFRYITLPLSARALSAGMVLAWARAVGEFGATILFAGSLPGRTQTMPLLVYAVFERDIDAAIWTGVLLLAVALVALFFSRLLQPNYNSSST